jgi:hypothetical protein
MYRKGQRQFTGDITIHITPAIHSELYNTEILFTFQFRHTFRCIKEVREKSTFKVRFFRITVSLKRVPYYGHRDTK